MQPDSSDVPSNEISHVRLGKLRPDRFPTVLIPPSPRKKAISGREAGIDCFRVPGIETLRNEKREKGE